MAGSLEVIRSYLVSLGFDVDKSSYDDVTKKIDTFSSKLTQFGGQAAKLFAQAATAVTAFGVAATAGMAKFLDGLGNQEIQMEMLSRQLWTTQQQAMAFNATLKAMGTNLQSLYLSPTLMQQYQQLHAVATEMQTPADYNQSIKQVQAIQLQIKQFKLEVYYALQWVGYYFVKYLQGPLGTVHNLLVSLNGEIVKNMPNWTKKVAQWMASFVEAGIRIGEAVGTVWNWLRKLAGYLPGWVKAVAAAFALISISNPFMLFIEGIAAALLLLDDFMIYLHGGKSEFAPFWAWIMKIVDGFKQIGNSKGIITEIKDAWTDLGNTFRSVKDFAIHLFNTFKNNGTLRNYIDTWKSWWHVMQDVGKAIGSLAQGIGHVFGLLNDTTNESDMTNFFQLLVNLGIGAEKIILGTIEELASLGNMAGDMLRGKFDAGAQIATDILTGKNLYDAGIISGYLKSLPNMYITPPASTTSNTKTFHVTANQNNYIQSNSPGATATSLQGGFNRLMNNLGGVIG